MATIGKIPSPGVLPFPFGEYLLQRAAHRFAIDLSAGEDAQRAQHGRMIAIAFAVGLRTVLMRQVDTVLDGQGGEFRADFVPLGLRRQARALTPALRDVERVVPIFEFEGGVPGLARRMVLLRGNHRRTQDVARALRVPMRVARHELGGFEDDVTVTFQRVARRARGVDQLCHRDGVRLLPDEQRADGRWTVAAIGRGHLGPARARVALLPGLLAGRGQNRAVPSQAALQ